MVAERFDFGLNAWIHDDLAPVSSEQALALSAPPFPGYWTNPKRHRKFAWINFLGLIALGALVAVMIGAIATENKIVVASTAAIWLFGGAWIASAANREEWSPTPEDLRLLENPEDRDVFMVEILIRKEMTGSFVKGTFQTVGQDRGVAWLERGALFYSGHRTSFVIGGEDVLPQEDWKIDYDMVRFQGPAIPLCLPEGRAHVVVATLVRSRQDEASRAGFERQLLDFRRLRPRSKVESRQWPPLEK